MAAVWCIGGGCMLASRGRRALAIVPLPDSHDLLNPPDVLQTFTIYGSEKEPGLTPRGVNELFKVSLFASGCMVQRTFGPS